MKKRMALLITLLLCLLSCTNCLAFSDSEGTWYEHVVNYAVAHSMINGYSDNTFRGGNDISKAEIIKLVVARYMDSAEKSDGEHWAMPYVRFAESNNIIPAGMYNETNLEKSASRKEICYMLIQACRNIAYKPVLDDTDMKLDFEDLNEENKESINENGLDYAQAMRLCYAMGIIKGYPTREEYRFTTEDGLSGFGFHTFPKLVKPNENVTRAEAAVMAARTYFARYRQYTFIERTQEELPSNASDYAKTYTYMPKSFYEAGKDSFFKFLPGENSVNFFSQFNLDDGTGKARIEDAYDILFNISYKMTDEQWELWKQEILRFSLIKSQIKHDEMNLDEYIQFIKDNKIVIKGGYIVDPITSGEVESNIVKENSSMPLMKGIATLYIENPNNVDDVSINQFEWHRTKAYINKSFDRGYVFYLIGASEVISSNYIQNLALTTAFFFSND